VLVVLAVLALLAAVAIAAGGPAPTGSGGARRPADWVLDIGVSLFIVLMVFGAVLWIALIVFAPSAASNPTPLKRDPRRRMLASLGVFVFLIVLALGVSRIGGDGGQRKLPIQAIAGQQSRAANEKPQYSPEFALVPVIVTLLLVAIAATAGVIAYRSRRRPAEPDDAALAAALADVLDDTLDDIRAEQDPRKAVIIAYSRFERVLAWYGAPREPAEAPEEYLERVLLDLEVPRGAVTRLTALFAEAKFSQHDVDRAMKNEAIDALETTRKVLRAVDERERAMRAEALAASLGREPA
jgi:Domain of unknown function (DUF4129)